MKTSASWALLLLLPSACFPGAPPPPAEEPVPGPEPVQEGAIPWAPGEGPLPTRDVGEQPRSQDDPLSDTAYESTQGDGVDRVGKAPGCTGRVPLPLRAEVQARTAALKVCNERAPLEFRGSGELKYTLRVESDGRVHTIYQLENTLPLSEVILCVEAKLKERFEETPLSGCAQFVVPYQLVVEEGQEVVDETQETDEPSVGE